MKKALITAFLIAVFFQSATAAITNYNVPETINLNKTLTIYGEYSGGADIVCSFFIFDIEDQNQVIIRLTDEYTNTLGQFYSEYQITEPLFRRGIDYNAVTVCGTDKIGSVFYVEQKEDIFMGISPEMIRNDFAFWTNRENSLTALFVMMFIIIGGAFTYWLYNDLRNAARS